MKKYTFCALSIMGFSAVANANIAACLVKSYPEISSVNNNTVIFKNGNSQPIGNVTNQSFIQKLNNPSVADQFSIRYALDFHIPKQYEDAGRIRNDNFFKNLYGSTASEITKNLVKVYWKPANKYIQFNRKNNAASQLEKVGNEIALYPELTSYVAKTLGSYNFRKIAGTNRLSPHSFGTAIDFTLPKHLHKYWRWSGCKSEDQKCPYPAQLMQDQKLQQIVRIFEKHGFIWGGKWASYDSVHFEYRPELLNSQCYL
jgi:hypothetical protein